MENIHNIKPLPDFIQRLKIELETIKSNKDKLNSFIGTDAFNKLEGEHPVLLKEQLVHMENLVSVLEKRFNLLVAEL